MSTDQTFNDMLKRYTPFKLHFEELKKHNWFINRVKKKEDWNGGVMEIPFEAAEATSLEWGQLVADDDISEGEYLMGELTDSDLKELWGAMAFHNKDLKRHGGNMEASYLQLLPGRLKQFSQYMSEQVSITYFGDGSLAKATANGTVGGALVVDFPQRFHRGQKVQIASTEEGPVTAYVKAININTKTLSLVTTRGGATAVDLSAYLAAESTKIYIPSHATNGPTTLSDALLSAANGGSATYFGYTKADYPILQAINVDGSGFDAETLLDDLYEAFYTITDLGKGSLKKTMVLPLVFMQHISKQLEGNKRYEVSDKKSGYGFRSITLDGVDGSMEMTFIRDAAKDRVAVLDWETLHLCGNNFFKRDTDANGNEFFVKRTQQGRINIVDTAFEAALVVNCLSHNGIIHGIPSL